MSIVETVVVVFYGIRYYEFLLGLECEMFNLKCEICMVVLRLKLDEVLFAMSFVGGG